MLPGVTTASLSPASPLDCHSREELRVFPDSLGFVVCHSRQRTRRSAAGSKRLDSVSASHQPALAPHGRGSARIAVFVSGGGSNFRAIHESLTTDRVPATIEVVVTDSPACGGCRYAAEHGIQVIQYPDERQASFPEESANRLRQALKEENHIDYVLLAGYIKLIPAALVAAYPRAMLNIHPGLLPAFGGKGFYGSRVHQAVIKSGARFTGPTVHFVDEMYDRGPILAQRVIPVNPLEDYKQLAARVLKEEHKLYPAAVAALVENRIGWRDDGVPIIWDAS